MTQTTDKTKTIECVVHEHVLKTIEMCGGQKRKAARELGISRSTLYRILARTHGNQKGSI